MDDLIKRADALEQMAQAECGLHYADCEADNCSCSYIQRILDIPSAEAVQIHNDGTLEIKVPNAHKVGRVLVMDTDSHIGGGLFYQDDAEQGWRISKPTEQGKYIVTLDSFGHKRIDLFYYGKPMMPNRKVRGKCWYRDDDEWGDVVYDDTDILAWQPLPKPYGERAGECE